MLRITITEDAAEQRWSLHGRLEAPWVAELETTWRERGGRDARKCVVDLSEVTRIDKRGEKVLKAMKEAGAELIACGVYVRQVVDDIATRCRRFRRSA
jgi:anti-anti-sigma regulatory factor